MTLEDKDKNALIKYRIERSEAALKAARREFEAEDMFAATNRIYYACFYSVEALMLTKGLSYERYGQLRKEFNKEFVESGLIDDKYSTFLKEVLKQRHMGDYGDYVEFNKETTEASLEQAEEFVKEVNKITMKYVNGN